MGSQLFLPVSFSHPFNYAMQIAPGKKGESGIYRNPSTVVNGLRYHMHLGISTIWEALMRNLEEGRGYKSFLGKRKIVENVNEGCEKINNDSKSNNKGCNKIDEDSVEWLSYREVVNKAECFSCGIRKLGLCPETNLPKEDRTYRFFGIYSKNNIEWFLSYFGCTSDSITLVTIYDTLGLVGIKSILEQTKLETILTEGKNLENLLKICKENKTFNLKNLILIDEPSDPKIKDEIKEFNINIYTFNDVIESGKELKEKGYEFKRPKGNDILTIFYTSGTTGIPKGAKITHLSLLLATESLEDIGLSISPSDLYFSYLPLAHVMESLLLAMCVSRGCTIGVFSGDPRNLGKDMQILKPTCMVAVPRVLQRVYEGIINGVKGMGYISKKIFYKGIKMKIEALEKDNVVDNVFWDNLVFHKVKDKFGGRLKWMIVGSAPMDPYILNFLRVALSMRIMLGYGQTEDCAGALLSHSLDPKSSYVGGPCLALEMKLILMPELNENEDKSRVKSKKNINGKDNGCIKGEKSMNGILENQNKCDENKEDNVKKEDKSNFNTELRGEILVRGSIVFDGYLSDPEKTKDVIDEEGWLHTGDVGVIEEELGNVFKIVDRVKNIFKLQQGEYIAPEKLESILLNHPLVEQIFVTGDSNKSYLVAIIYPSKTETINYFKSKGNNEINDDNWGDYLNDKAFCSHIVEELEKYGRKNDFKGFEIIKKVRLIKEPMKIENDLISPTLKIKRYKTRKFFQEEIEKLYKN